MLKRASVLMLYSLLGGGQILASETSNEFYENQVKPILAERCFACHGTLKQEAGLRLDALSQIRAGGDSGPTIDPGHGDESLIIQRVTADESERMPPEGAPLSTEQIAILRKWIDEGANGPDELIPPDPREHWAFVPPVRTDIAAPSLAGSASNPIDALLSVKYREIGLHPSQEASKATLLRRIYLDLIGIPPTRHQLHAFLTDPTPTAYEQVVDDLLASPQYGVRWARHWMDVWRYSDWFGLESDHRFSQRHMWRFRDWIVDSLNSDKGYDRMIVEMLAADEIAPDDDNMSAANGFLGRHWYLYNRNVWLDNVVDSTGRGLLGLTMNCARCHDHKYDPITQEDYYSLRAFFEPHKVRTEPVPGQVDTKEDGMPRAYDAELDAPTYLFVRGNELDPDKKTVIKPAVPTSLGGELPIQPVNLPLAAYYPAMRSFEQQDKLAALEKKCVDTLAGLQKANDEAAMAERKLAALLLLMGKQAIAAVPAGSQNILLTDDFSKPRPDLWQTVDGSWQYEGDCLVQKQASAKSVLKSTQNHPTDLVATADFTIVEGGTQSVGIAFDSDEHGYIGVYMSPSISKVQLYSINDGVETYPAEAARTTPVESGKQYNLKVAVQGQLVNVWVDGQLMIAHRLLSPRRPGRFALTSFEAVVKFIAVTVAALPSETKLFETTAIDPSVQSPEQVEQAEALAHAKLVVETAAKKESAARAERGSLIARMAAENAKYGEAPPSDLTSLTQTAAQAEKASLLAQAEAKVATAKLKGDEARAASKRGEKGAAEMATQAEQDLATGNKELSSLLSKLDVAPTSYAPLGTVYPRTSSGRRTALARWIADRRNPLTARVAVNHIWTRHFGQPIVASMFDFGLRTPKPLHADVLDSLAVEFMDSGWSMKKLHKSIVMSEAYRRASPGKGDNANEKLDADNLYLWRMNPRRMEGEIVRDSLLSLAGKLDTAVGGHEQPVKDAATGTRRTIYYRYAREPVDKVPVIAAFDPPNVEECFLRQETIVPQHALFLMNSSMSLGAAADIANAIENELSKVGSDESSEVAFISTAFEQILGRSASKEEITTCQLALPQFEKLAAGSVHLDGGARQHARQGLVHVLLNHNDFVTIR